MCKKCISLVASAAALMLTSHAAESATAIYFGLPDAASRGCATFYSSDGNTWHGVSKKDTRVTADWAKTQKDHPNWTEHCIDDLTNVGKQMKSSEGQAGFCFQLLEMVYEWGHCIIVSKMNDPAPASAATAQATTPAAGVNFHGNTVVHTPLPWNPYASYGFWVSWWEAPAAPNPNNISTVLWIKNGSQLVGLNELIPNIRGYVIEQENHTLKSADILVAISGPLLPSGTGATYTLYATTQTAPIPRNNIWHMNAVSINTATGTGAFAMVQAGGTNVEFAPLTIQLPDGGFIPNWDITTDWYNGGDDGYYDSGHQNWFPGAMAEFYVNIDPTMQLSPTAVDGHFATKSGQAIGLSHSVTAHDCANPTGKYPTLCYTGDPNFWLHGPAFTFLATEPAGSLRPISNDPCEPGYSTTDGCRH
jgi:hypothetical protein